MPTKNWTVNLTTNVPEAAATIVTAMESIDSSTQGTAAALDKVSGSLKEASTSVGKMGKSINKSLVDKIAALSVSLDKLGAVKVISAANVKNLQNLTKVLEPLAKATALFTKGSEAKFERLGKGIENLALAAKQLNKIAVTNLKNFVAQLGVIGDALERVLPLLEKFNAIMGIKTVKSKVGIPAPQTKDISAWVNLGQAMRQGLEGPLNMMKEMRDMAFRGLFYGALFQAVGGIQKLASSFVEQVAQGDALRRQFIFLRGNRASGEAEFNRVTQYAIGSTYTLQQLANLDKMMISLRLDTRKYLPMLSEMALGLSDITNGTKKAAESATRLAFAIAKLQGGSRDIGRILRSLNAAGISNKEIIENLKSQNLPFALGKGSRVIDVKNDDMIKAVEAIYTARFKGISLALINSWGGIISAFEDAWFRFSNIAAKYFFGDIKIVMMDIFKLLDGSKGDLSGWAESFGKSVGDWLLKAKAFAEVFYRLFDSFATIPKLIFRLDNKGEALLLMMATISGAKMLSGVGGAMGSFKGIPGTLIGGVAGGAATLGGTLALLQQAEKQDRRDSFTGIVNWMHATDELEKLNNPKTSYPDAPRASMSNIDPFYRELEGARTLAFRTGKPLASILKGEFLGGRFAEGPHGVTSFIKKPDLGGYSVAQLDFYHKAAGRLAAYEKSGKILPFNLGGDTPTQAPAVKSMADEVGLWKSLYVSGRGMKTLGTTDIEDVFKVFQSKVMSQANIEYHNPLDRQGYIDQQFGDARADRKNAMGNLAWTPIGLMPKDEWEAIIKTGKDILRDGIYQTKDLIEHGYGDSSVVKSYVGMFRAQAIERFSSSNLSPELKALAIQLYVDEGIGGLANRMFDARASRIRSRVGSKAITKAQGHQEMLDYVKGPEMREVLGQSSDAMANIDLKAAAFLEKTDVIKSAWKKITISIENDLGNALNSILWKADTLSNILKKVAQSITGELLNIGVHAAIGGLFGGPAGAVVGAASGASQAPSFAPGNQPSNAPSNNGGNNVYINAIDAGSFADYMQNAGGKELGLRARHGW